MERENLRHLSKRPCCIDVVGPCLFSAGRRGQVVLAVREPQQHTLDTVLAAPGDHTEEINAIGTSHLKEP